MTEKVGVLGGTFDPVHLGHLVVAQEVHQQLKLDRTVLVPAGEPPHRSGTPVTPASIRLRMLRAAIADDDRFAVSTFEVDRPGPSYTVDTLERMRLEWPEAGLYLVIGSDQWQRFHTWRSPERIAEMATLVVVGRNGEAGTEMELPHVRMEVPRIDVSSSGIRERVRAGESIRFLVPDSVCRIIEGESLYHEGYSRSGLTRTNPE